MLESQPRSALVAELFVRGLGIVYAIAFASIGVQIIGLVGQHGIEPAAELLARMSEDGGTSSALPVPTWLWITGTSDWMLRSFCIAGVLCSLSIAAWRLPRVALFCAWSLYLSLCSVGSVFLSYQWDTLLLECGIVGLFVATPGSALGLWLARALCLKLMFLSGVVKLASGDPTWRNLTAMSFHFWTQPLPAWPAVFADKLPESAKAALTAGSMVVELVAPPFIFAPRRARHVAAAALALLQVGIAATGSYGFFNLLSLLLCAALLDDEALLALCPPRLRTALRLHADARAQLDATRNRSGKLARVGRSIHAVLAAALLTASLCAALNRFIPLPEPFEEFVVELAPLRSSNSYGLFAVMTTDRREIGLEGSLDGKHWRPYEFEWKPDRLDERPRFSTPHMPRLDWQMWFAALGRCQRQRWFHNLMARVLEGEPSVLDLFAANPFPDAPPRYLRTPQAQYRFAPGAAWLHGQWWISEATGQYCPEVRLQDGKLVRAQPE